MGYDLDRVFSLSPGGASKNVNIEDAKVHFTTCSIPNVGMRPELTCI